MNYIGPIESDSEEEQDKNESPTKPNLNRQYYQLLVETKEKKEK